MTVWFTSDTHYCHANIIQYAKRPFTDVNEMNEAMITNWNSVVRPGDQVYHLGDFCLGRVKDAVKIAKKLSGQKFLIFGNHDKRLRKEKEFLGHWAWSGDYKEIKAHNGNSVTGAQKIILMHYALRVWNQAHRGSWALYGHSHGSLKDDPNALSVDVGVDCWDYYPVSFEEIRKRMSHKNYKSVDHHGSRKEEE